MYKIILSFLICLFPFTSNAEESIPEYLTSTPVTLMDHGLDGLAEKFRLQTVINSKGYSVNPYWAKEEGFVLRIISDNKNKADTKSAIENCKLAISEVKNWLGVNPNTGKPKDGVASYFGAFFESYGSTYGDSVESFRKSIDVLVTIKGFMETTSEDGVAKCSSKLIEQ